jgi:predicted DNA-binding transcriptional regulator YafY
MREFLGELPNAIVAKAAQATGGGSDESPDTVTRLTAAVLGRRKATITYDSFSSRRIKDYAIEPYRIVYGDGSLYLFAYVPAYGEMRTFAVKRIKKLSVLEETFEAAQEVPAQPFGHSLGINVGTPVHVEIEFAERVAPYIRERVWHPSQTVVPRPDGSVVLTLDVCLDRALTRWILGFGPFARVVSPPTLAEQILEELEDAREVYVPRLAFSGDSSDPE